MDILVGPVTNLSFIHKCCPFVPAGQPEGSAGSSDEGATTPGQGADRCVLQACDPNSTSVALAAMRGAA